MKREYKDNISIDEVKSGETIRTDAGKYYLVIKMPHIKPRFIEFDASIYKYEVPGKITEVFATNGVRCV